MVLKGLTKPPFTENGSDRNISLELLSYKTAFLVALATGGRGSELVARSRAKHNLTFIRLASGAKHVSVRMLLKFIPKNARPDVIPKLLEFPGIAHLFSSEPERLLCPVQMSGYILLDLDDLANEDSQMFTTHSRRWVAETIQLTYENSLESDLSKIKSHEVRAVAASVAFYRNTPISELCGSSAGSHPTSLYTTILEIWHRTRIYNSFQQSPLELP